MVIDIDNVRGRYGAKFIDAYEYIPDLCDEIDRLREENMKLKAKLFDRTNG